MLQRMKHKRIRMLPNGRAKTWCGVECDREYALVYWAKRLNRVTCHSCLDMQYMGPPSKMTPARRRAGLDHAHRLLQEKNNGR